MDESQNTSENLVNLPLVNLPFIRLLSIVTYYDKFYLHLMIWAQI